MARTELLLRRQRLLERSALLRHRFAAQAQALRSPLSLAECTWAFGSWLRRNPLWPLGAVGALLLVRPRRALRWSLRLYWIWSALRQARRWLRPGPGRGIRAGYLRECLND